MATPTATSINPTHVRYIKLGEGGSWANECLERGIIRTGFATTHPDRARTRFELCQSERWNELADCFIADGRTQGTATRFKNELRLFFQDDGTTLWITFMRGRLYWGMVENAPPEMHADGTEVLRRVRGGWRDTDLNGNPLSTDRLSGAVTMLAAYQGTSCKVAAAAYVIRRINVQPMPQVERALAASREMSAAALDLIRMLTSQDFELLVDLVFTTSGWRRVGVVGTTQETVDFELVLPSTGERAFVQVKSTTTTAQLAEYVARLGERADLYSRMFYVFHSGEPEPTEDRRVTLVGPKRLAKMVVDAGLTGWLIEKVS